MALLDASAHSLARQVRAGSLKAETVVAATLERIAAVDGRPPSSAPYVAEPGDERAIHAYLSIQGERALEQAAAVDAAVARGEDPGPLAGVPLSVKDIFCVAGMPTTAGSRMLERYVAPYTATPVARLEAAGAIVIGKVNLDEFAYGSSNESSAFRPTPRNPWDASRVPGGSSGGSAASVAAGEAVLSIGTDTAGSIRVPAAYCGVVGLKPTYGRVSRYGLIAFGSSLDCPGPIARTVHDAALALQVMAGADPHDATTVTTPVADYVAGLSGDVRGLRVGLSPDYFRIRFPGPHGTIIDHDLPAEVVRATLDAAQALAQAGAEIVEQVALPNTSLGIPCYFVLSRVEAASNLHRFDGVKYGHRTGQPVADLQALYRRSRAEGFGVEPKLRILMGMYVSGAQYAQQYYQKALRVRALIRRDFDRVFDPAGAERLDALLTPTAPSTAFKIGDVFGDSVLMQYADVLAVNANHAGSPAISIPAGRGAEGLPLGAQLIGRDYDEATLLRLAHAIETVTAQAGWRQARPAVLA
jgi:aspartyl-tRNA(Asn)/glutamyl-tRNA(Gln) amidotransferase subunit A